MKENKQGPIDNDTVFYIAKYQEKMAWCANNTQTNKTKVQT